MDLPTILVKVTGAILLLWTMRSIYKHVNEKIKTSKVVSSKKEDTQSVSEHVLNGILLYVWLAFMVTFSSGMILNN